MYVYVRKRATYRDARRWLNPVVNQFGLALNEVEGIDYDECNERQPLSIVIIVEIFLPIASEVDPIYISRNETTLQRCQESSSDSNLYIWKSILI